MFNTLLGMCLRLTMGALGYLPFTMRSRLGMLLGPVVCFFNRRDSKVSLLQMHSFLGFSTRDSLCLTRRCYGSLIATFLESLTLQDSLNSGEIEVVVDEEQIRCLLSKEPTLILTAHFGNWELMGAYAALRGIPLLSLARRARIPAVDHELRRLRERNGYEIAWKDDSSTGRELIRHLRAGGCVASLLDQDMRGRGEFFDFFGLPAKVNTSLIELALRVNASIVTAFCIRETSKRFRIELRQLSVPHSVDSVVNEYHHILEHAIRAYPDQWAWLHKRWRSRPDGRRLRTGEYLKFVSSLTSNKGIENTL